MGTNVTMDEISERVRRFVLENFMYGYDESRLSDDTSFLELGVLDSTGIMEMIALIESSFDIEVRDQEILPDNFDSIFCVSRYVYGKLNGREVELF